MVKSASDNTNYHTVYFGDNVNFCLSKCKEFRKTGMLYKNIITVVLVGKKTFPIYQFYIWSIRLWIYTKIFSKIFKRMKVRDK